MDAQEIVVCFHDKERRALDALVEIYGDDTNEILNALHSISVRLAIASGVDGKDFAAGMKYHWDNLANAFNERAHNSTNA
jgi:hypothetical protein